MHIEVAPAKPKKKQKDQFTTLNLFWTSILYQTKEFFNNSTLHGVRYIAEEGRPFGERFMWFCFTVTGGVSALIIIVSLWEKFQTNPTITGNLLMTIQPILWSAYVNFLNIICRFGHGLS